MGRCGNRSYAARAKLELAVERLPDFLPGPSTWARSHGFTYPVEAKYAPYYNYALQSVWQSVEQSILQSTEVD